ncbi:hypothetical protein CI105_01305 [Candidatus Izimaplasma bacterium ZiA1]|uniref:DUF4011 domain-containing protein n=1 Tax=Candidatus Izimoplasma sp. ZiA1 TaxID=2024899 RepID=UPI000BAA4F8E|nr:hypothetical protein CI105_01305 [Candidatus Izimaplasma bacterium ZiA1]
MESQKSLVETMIINARDYLLDTSFNNRMINSKITLNKGLSFNVEDLDSLYNLVIKNNSFSFLPLENKKKEKGIVNDKSLVVDTEKNKNYEKVGALTTISLLDSNNNPSLIPIKLRLEEGASKLIYQNDKESEFYQLIDGVYNDVKKNFSKYGIDQDKIYNNNVIFTGFKKNIKNDVQSTILSIYLAFVSLFKNEGINKSTIVLGGLNDKNEITTTKNVIEKITLLYEKGYKRVILSKKNKKDIKTLPMEILNTIEIVYLTNIDDAVLAMFDMFNTVDYQDNEGEFLLSKKSQLQKVFYVNYNRDDLKVRLEKIYANAKNHIEEQGINILFLSFGFCQWKNEQNDNELIHSPLIFLPVTIETSNYKNVYKFSYSNSEIILNKSLIKKLELEYNLDLSSLELEIANENEFSVNEYIEQFFNLIKNSGYDFGIDSHTVHLSFYSYNKFLMYNDLDPQNWETALNGESKNILTDIFVNNIYHEVSNIDDDKLIDNTREIDTIKNILDADSSQLLAISKVNRGNSIIIQGPPGTGKSQTIVNIIAEAVRNNKKVLFMSEKLAAMEVVYNRLKALNLSHIALQLHSDKVNKAQVVKELQSIYYMNKLNIKNRDPLLTENLSELKKEINQYYELLHRTSKISKRTLIETYQDVIELENYFDLSKVNHYDLVIPNPYLTEISDAEFNKIATQLEIMENYYSKYGSFKTSPLNGVTLRTTLSHHDLMRFSNNIDSLIKNINDSIKVVSYIKIPAIKTGGITLEEILNLEKIKEINNDLDEYINDINHSLIVNNKDKLEEIFSLYNLSSVSNSLVRTEIIQNLVYVNDLETYIGNLVKEIQLYSNFNGCLKRRKSNYKILRESIVSKYLINNDGSYAENLESLKWLYSNLSLKLLLLKEDTLLEKCFGKRFKEDKSDINRLNSIYNSVEVVYQSIKVLFKDKSFKEDLFIDYYRNFIKKDLSPIKNTIHLLEDINNDLKINKDVFLSTFNTNKYTKCDLNILVTHFKKLKHSLPALNDFIVLKDVKIDIENNIMDPYLVSLLNDEKYDTHISKAFRYIRLHSIIKDILSNNEKLEKFNAMIFEQKVREFIYLDNKNIQTNNLQEVLDSHFLRVYNIRKDETLSKENKDEKISYLLKTFNKKHNIPNVKKLLKDAFDPITKLKPVFMMSPISISQYLEPIVGMFDIVVFDEASQIKPQDAFGSLLRGKQVVVVGDEKQLPPTNFFESFYGSTDIFEEDTISNYESILTLLRGSGVPLTTLNWHYRSKHHNLIKISNEHFYDKSLSIFPSKYKNNPEYGLKLHYVDGIFDRGRTRTNIIEAKEIVKYVVNHAKTTPDLSLGVATLNINQRDLISSELKKVIKDDVTLDSFFDEDKIEPFFIKNLENVQGDEREVILISIAYAKDQNGNIIQNFGAINHIGGERRLNVLMTRAKQKCVIFTGLKSHDLEVDYRTSEGVNVLKKFLQFVENKFIEEPEEINSDSKLFAIEIAEELNKHGYVCDYTIGNDQYYIDLAILNPNDESEYLLGIEFDDSTFSQSRTASERERIRNKVMRAKGWAIYKIYLPSWFNNRQQEIEDILKYIKSIKAKRVEEIEEEIEFNLEPVNVVTRFGFEPYKKYKKMIENINFFMKDNGDFNQYILDLVYCEMPIKLGLIIDRVVENSHTIKKSNVVKNRIKKALNSLEHNHNIYVKNGFYYYYQKEDFIKFRDRRNVLNEFSLSNISDDEFIHAIKEVIRNSFGITTTDISSIISNYFGYENTNLEVEKTIERLCVRLMSNNQIYKDENDNLQFNK